MSAAQSPPTLPSPRPWALRTVPVFPANAAHLIRVLEDAAFSMDEVVEVARAHPALSSELLRLANSVQYARRKEIVELRECFLLLGSRQAAQAALAFATRVFCKPTADDPRLATCWTHSLATATLAEALAAQADVPPRRAYTYGLLHDVGALVLAATYPEEYAETLSLSEELKLERLAAERELFDVDHCEAGGLLIENWGLPAVLSEITRDHHNPLVYESTPVSLVSRAAAISERLGYSQRRKRRKGVDLPSLLSDFGFTPVDETVTKLSESLGRLRSDVRKGAR